MKMNQAVQPQVSGAARMLRDVVAGVHLINDSYVNWYLLEEGDDLTIVDAGLPSSWNSLVRAVNILGHRLSDIRALILTHAHFDHVGFAERARRQLGIPVLCHRDEVPITKHPLRYPHERTLLPYIIRPKAIQTLASFALWGGFWPRAIERVSTFEDGDVLDVPGSPHVVFTPGHTPGHCSLHLPAKETVIAGDALVTYNPYTGSSGPQLVARAATANSEQALASLNRLRDTGARLLPSGHGPVWAAGVEEAVQQAFAAGLS